MRITGGEAGGRTILSPKGMKVRPTPDMIREALFNILGSMQETTFLDLFAGTGSVGLEALSRGAPRVVFVEINAQMAFQISDFIRKADYVARAEVLALDVRQAIARLAKTNEKFDIVFADPPYEKDLIAKAVQYCLESGLMADEGLMILQHSIREPLDQLAKNNSYKLVQERRYGDSLISFMRYSCEEY